MSPGRKQVQKYLENIKEKEKSSRDLILTFLFSYKTFWFSGYTFSWNILAVPCSFDYYDISFSVLYVGWNFSF